MSELQLCRLGDLVDGGGRGFEVELDGKPLAVVAVRRGDRVWLYRNRCPHFSVKLDVYPGTFSTYRGEVLMCAHHSAMFRFDDGVCVEGPCKGRQLEALAMRMQAGGVYLQG